MALDEKDSEAASPDSLIIRWFHQQREHWNRGDRVLAESFLRTRPELAADPDRVLDLICHELVLAKEQGETPRLEDYLTRFPQWSDQIKRQFEVEDVLGDDSMNTANLQSRLTVSISGDGPGIVDEAARRTFELAWRQHPPAVMEDFLPAADSPYYFATLEELIRIDLWMRWKSAHPVAESNSQPSEPPPDLAHYFARFPQLVESAQRRLFREETRIRKKYGDPLDATTRQAADNGWPAIDGYEIEAVLGKGGMGIVYKARQKRLNRVVALKTVLRGAETEELLRFLSEAEAVARLQHPHIVQIYEVNKHEGRPFFSMEFASEGTLTEKLKGAGPVSATEAADLIERIARAVEYAHSRGIVHRDLKPANILLTKASAEGSRSGISTFKSPRFAQFVPKISDFGLAKYMDMGFGLTQTGAIVGTPSYMAPEQAAGKSGLIGPGTDIHALGAILYEMLTGRPPYQAPSLLDTLELVRSQEAASPRALQPKIPRDLETICMKCLHKEPARRYASAGDFADDLERFLRDVPIKARPVGQSERLWRWCRRNPVVASLLSIVALLLVTGTVVASYMAWHLDRVAQNEARLRRHAETQEEIAKQKTAKVEELHRNAQSALAERYTFRGLVAHDQNEPGQAFLWFAHGLNVEQTQATTSANLVRVRSWSRFLSVPQRAFPHDQYVFHAAFHPSGDRLLTLTTGGRLTIWDVSAEAPIAWPGIQQGIAWAEWSPDGGELTAGTSQGRVELRRFPEGDLRQELDHPKGLTTLAYSRDGKLLALGGSAARVWDRTKQDYVTKLLEHPDIVKTLTFSPDGARLVTGCLDDQARLYDLADAGEPLRFPHIAWKSGFSSVPAQPIFLKQGAELTTVASADQIAKWDSATGKQTQTEKFSIEGKGPAIFALAANPQATQLAIGGHSGARLWTVGRASLEVPQMKHANYVRAFAVSPDGEMLLSASVDRTARLWSMKNGAPLGAALQHQSGVALAGFSPNGKRFFTGQNDGLIRIWAVPRGNSLDRTMSIPLAPTFARLDSTGKYVLPTGANYLGHPTNLDKSIRVHDAATGLPAGEAMPIRGHLVNALFAPHEPEVLTVSFVPKNSQGTPEGWAQFWNWKSGAKLSDAVQLKSEPRGVAYSSDGKRAAVHCFGGEIYVLDTTNSAVVFKVDTLSSSVAPNSYPGVRFAEQDRTLISFGTDRRIHVWDLTTGKLRYAPMLHSASIVNDAVLSRDDRWLTTSGWDQTVRVWEFATGRETAVLPHPDWVYSAHFDESGETIVTACRDGMARVWNWRNGKLASPPCQHKDAVYSAQFLPGENYLITASRDGSVRLWDRRTALPIAPPFDMRSGKWNWRSSAGPKAEPWNAVADRTGERAVVGGDIPTLYALHLADLKDSGDLPLQDPILFGNLLSGFEVNEEVGVEGLTSAQWLQRWKNFRKQNPEFGR